MIVNRRIETAAHVEALATEPEGETLDYKGDVGEDLARPWELAKDLAAFANHLGGVLVVGAFENGATGLPNLGGVSAQRANEAERAYENAAKDFCRPSPLVTFERIPWRGDRVILAVSVRASLAFVCARSESTNGWQFTVRTGRHNPPLSPEQATMYMSTHARRIALLLAAIPPGAEISVVSTDLEEASKSTVIVGGPAHLRSFDLQRNRVSFALTDAEVSEPAQTLPLDDIETVWEGEDRWYVRVTGYFEEYADINDRWRTSYYSRTRRAT